MKNYSIMVEFSSGYKHNLNTNDYEQAREWWTIFANDEAAKNCKIVYMVMTDNHKKTTICQFCPKGMANAA